MVRKGFTLIELLVVIAIIAILAAILFPVFSRVQRKAKGAACMSNEKQLMSALLMYVSDCDNLLPPTCQPSADHTLAGWAGTANGGGSWIWPYLQNEEVFSCPGAQQIRRSTVDIMYTYTMNGYGINGAQRMALWCRQSVETIPWTTHLIMFMEGFIADYYHFETRKGATKWIGEGAWPNTWGATIKASDDPPNWYISGSEQLLCSHGQKLNCAFLDGHVAAMDLNILRNSTGATVDKGVYYFDPSLSTTQKGQNGNTWTAGYNCGGQSKP